MKWRKLIAAVGTVAGMLGIAAPAYAATGPTSNTVVSLCNLRCQNYDLGQAPSVLAPGAGVLEVVCPVTEPADPYLETSPYVAGIYCWSGGTTVGVGGPIYVSWYSDNQFGCQVSGISVQIEAAIEEITQNPCS